MMVDELDAMIVETLQSSYSKGKDHRALAGRRMSAREYRAFRRLLARLNRGLPKHMRVRNPKRRTHCA